MSTRHAACCCGQLRVSCNGEPVRLSICHCLECQRRTGSVIGTQARLPRSDVRSEGDSTAYRRPGDEGGTVTFHFCPRCGSTVYRRLQRHPDLIAVAVGAFADPGFGTPRHSVYERRRHGWVLLPDGLESSIWISRPLRARRATCRQLLELCSDTISAVKSLRARVCEIGSFRHGTPSRRHTCR